jgi:hypothetical protein
MRAGACGSCDTARHGPIARIAGLLCVAGLLTVAAPASAYHNPNYPGSTLSLSLAGAAAVGKITTITATGTNTDNVTPAFYSLDVYAKRASEDNKCADTSQAEKNTLINEPHEGQIAYGLDEGFGPFSVPVKAQFVPGEILLCAYSLWSYDTAVSAELRFTNPSSGPPNPATAYKQAIAKCNKLRGTKKKNCITRAKLAQALAACKHAGGKQAEASCEAKARHRYHVPQVSRMIDPRALEGR